MAFLRPWVAFGVGGTFFASATPARAAEAARAAIWGCSAARERARRRAIGEPWRRIDAPGWAQGALGVVRGPKLAPLGRVWAPWHLVLRLRGAARAAAAPLMAPGGAGAARGSMRSIVSNDRRRRTGSEGGTSPRLVGFRKSRKALWASVPFEELSVSGGHASRARYAHRERALRA